jgi:DNA polymerase-3 subunit delta
MIYLLCGEDNFQSRQRINKIKEDFIKQDPSKINLATFDIEDVEYKSIKEAIQAQPFLAKSRLIIVNNLISKGYKNIQEKFYDLIDNKEIPESNEIILFESGKVKKNIRLYKIIKKLGKIEEFNPLFGYQLNKWIEDEFKNKGGKIGNGAISKLAAFVGNDLNQLNCEIDKLIVYKGDEEIIEKDIDLQVRAKLDDNIFNFVDALGRKDKSTALKLLHEQMEQGQNEIYLLTMISYQLRNLITIKSLSDLGVNQSEVAQKSKLHPYVVQKTMSQINSFDLEKLKVMYHDLLEADISFKTGGAFNKKLLLDMLVMKFCG